MSVIAQIGFCTTVLEVGATAIGAGVVVGGFVAAAAGMLLGRTRKEMEGNALRDVFWGGFGGMLCLCVDLFMRSAQWL
ncbi:MAG TPA: hypothetical protein VKC63_12255 [Solirubrobacterales bacterium]|nr:hypothetical protein [Solirubrobacterales bacterium]